MDLWRKIFWDEIYACNGNLRVYRWTPLPFVQVQYTTFNGISDIMAQTTLYAYSSCIFWSTFSPLGSMVVHHSLLLCQKELSSVLSHTTWCPNQILKLSWSSITQRKIVLIYSRAFCDMPLNKNSFWLIFVSLRDFVCIQEVTFIYVVVFLVAHQIGSIRLLDELLHSSLVD